MRVWHMSGAGNDFAVLDVRGISTDLAQLAIDLCQHTGSDGMMAVDTAKDADFRLHFYNSDGLRGEMCGNGSRCICRFAYENGIAGSAMTVLTDAGPIQGWRLSESQYRIKLNDPGVLDLHRKAGVAYVELGRPGIPHAVVELPGLTFSHKEQLRNKAVSLRHDPLFPKGANINFYTRLAEGQVRILTYERGVEDYTQACGTGSASVAVVLHALGQLPGGRLTVQNEGGTLHICLKEAQGRITALYLEGPTEILNIFDL
ncbi:MAG: diaminopimelate epimerase [Oscillospiraceae bacterium]|nr:diaminopimelate epimerase [Oscillospiraceae bacterium]